MMTPEQRATRARELLADEILNDAFDKLEKAAFDQLLSLPSADDRGRFDLTERIKAIRGVKVALQSEIDVARASSKARIQVA